MARTLTLTLAPTLALCGLLATAAAANAQSVGAPAGRDPATAPGGTEGLAGPRNTAEAIRSGDAIPVAPRTDGIPAGEQGVLPPEASRAPAPR
ncbi:hypothetical protein [Methylobacterium komagatae]